jgi:hypothetical protein
VGVGWLAVAWPEDCTQSETPSDDVVGEGVSVISDDLIGSSDHWGKVEDFVPGENTWVLSTGRIQDAVGQPSFCASTDLGGAGDAELSALSGFTTYDAAALSVTVVPNGHAPKVRYAFQRRVPGVRGQLVQARHGGLRRWIELRLGSPARRRPCHEFYSQTSVPGP